MNTLTTWALFNLLVVALLYLDLGVLNRKPHRVTTKEALGWTGFWISIALLFNLFLYWWQGPETGLIFLTGYLIEYSLSVDNLFVFLIIFSYFRVPPPFQHKALFWGIVGTIIMRVALIFIGVSLIESFHWLIYLFGAFLVFTGIKLMIQKDTEIQPEKNPVLKLFRRFMPITPGYEEANFFIMRDSRRWATPLFVVLLVITTTDFMFALDSVPAILAITLDPFLVYSSNVFAILGLRSLYFALAGIMPYFRFLSYGLSLILIFVGFKMIVADLYKISTGIALLIVAGILLTSILASLAIPDKHKNKTP